MKFKINHIFLFIALILFAVCTLIVYLSFKSKMITKNVAQKDEALEIVFALKNYIGKNTISEPSKNKLWIMFGEHLGDKNIFVEDSIVCSTEFKWIFIKVSSRSYIGICDLGKDFAYTKIEKEQNVWIIKDYSIITVSRMIDGQRIFRH